MSLRSYRWTILTCGLASAILLVLAYSHLCNLAVARGAGIDISGFVLAVVPGTFCVLVWMFQNRKTLRLAGLLSTSGVLIYSVYYFARAMGQDYLVGDMWFMYSLDGLIAIVLTLAWSVLSLIIGWIAVKSRSVREGAATPRPDTSL